MIWNQIYDPFGNALLSTAAAAIPVVVLLGAIAIFEMKAHWAAILGLATALAVAVFGFGMPAKMAGLSAAYSGIDATLGLAMAQTGWLYPFFGALIGWLGVALTGSDTSSNVLFGGLQKTSAEQLGLSPVLMAAANSSGGVMGKMIDAQSIVVASTATKWYGHEGTILRFVFFHSLALACLVGLLIMAQAYVSPFTLLVK